MYEPVKLLQIAKHLYTVTVRNGRHRQLCMFLETIMRNSLYTEFWQNHEEIVFDTLILSILSRHVYRTNIQFYLKFSEIIKN